MASRLVICAIHCAGRNKTNAPGHRILRASFPHYRHATTHPPYAGTACIHSVASGQEFKSAPLRYGHCGIKHWEVTYSASHSDDASQTPVLEEKGIRGRAKSKGTERNREESERKRQSRNCSQGG
ncbi:hypothetical protein DPEC_G00244540 [Dallia pectoralis]|uniref:Uncharacterized protein n=1 Tax=Dallia pectoralis TaxID=75939 RepID=A0ACC2FW17_DALPE|nr:hypothetical protein DPEC_G00244540 [Dallia pectoralis]